MYCPAVQHRTLEPCRAWPWPKYVKHDSSLTTGGQVSERALLIALALWLLEKCRLQSERKQKHFHVRERHGESQQNSLSTVTPMKLQELAGRVAAACCCGPAVKDRLCDKEHKAQVRPFTSACYMSNVRLYNPLERERQRDEILLKLHFIC